MVHLDFDHASGIARITLQRAEKRNALNRELVDRLADVFEGVSSEGACRVAVLSGEGNTFSAGADLKSLEDMQTASYEENEDDSRALSDLFRTIRRAPFNVVARVNGHAIAGGMGLMLACDYAVAVDTARFGFPETRIGMVPAIVSVYLAERVGGLVMRDLLLRGHLVDAHAALDLGLLSDVVPESGLDERVDEFVSELAAKPSPQAVAATKRLIDDIAGRPFDEALDLAVKANADARSSQDCRDGIAAFLSKTSPPWTH